MRRRLWGLPFTATLLVWSGCSTPQDAEVVQTDQAAATASAGFCRTTTCDLPDTFQVGENGLCEPPDWPQLCAAGKAHSGKSLRDAPLWWRSGCIGYSLQKGSSDHVSFEVLAAATAASFQAWTGARCPLASNGEVHPSIDVRDLGPVDCPSRGYDRSGPNHNVIAFHDDAWPYTKEGSSNVSITIALTTVMFNTETGEIYDADLELNSADHTIIPLTAGQTYDSNTFDLQSVLTHEIGHVFGLAHAPSPSSVMYAYDEGHDLEKRTLRPEDVAGICTIYPPDGTRSVDRTVDPSGFVARTACDPMPRRGMTTACEAYDPPKSCNATGAANGARGGGELALIAATAAAIGARRRRRSARAEA
jgi:hypothetical protein